MSQGGPLNVPSISGVVNTLTGNSGGAVAALGNNISTVGTGSITIVGNPGAHTLTTELTGLTNHSVLVGAGTATITSIANGSTGQVLTAVSGADPHWTTLNSVPVLIQQVRSTTGSILSGASSMPDATDNTAPTTSNGAVALTLSITPTSSSSVIFIEAYVPFFVINGGAGAGGFFLIQSGSATSFSAAYPNPRTVYFSGFFTAGTTSALTISLYYGTISGGTMFINSDTAGNPVGGGSINVILTATEYSP